jgi:hypothetical protein
MIGKVSWEPNRRRLRSQQAEFVENFSFENYIVANITVQPRFKLIGTEKQ